MEARGWCALGGFAPSPEDAVAGVQDVQDGIVWCRARAQGVRGGALFRGAEGPVVRGAVKVDQGGRVEATGLRVENEQAFDAAVKTYEKESKVFEAWQLASIKSAQE